MFRAIRRRLLPHWTDYWSEIVARCEGAPTLHLGAGFSPLSGATTVDINPETNPSVVWDLNQRPWPFADDTFDNVVALNILEHLDDFFAVMGEIHRVCRSDAEVSILVPHFSSVAAFVDPTHKQYLSAQSCDYFIPHTVIEGEYGFYVSYRFALLRRLVSVQGVLRFVPGVSFLAQRGTRFWEAYLCYLLRGSGIFWQLRPLKIEKHVAI